VTRPPHISFVQSIAPRGMLFYTGDKFPGWKRNLFVGSMRMSNSPQVTTYFVQWLRSESRSTLGRAQVGPIDRAWPTFFL
jgi:glucose/arabinose dehydrogenase